MELLKKFIETSLNRYVNLDPESKKHLQRLENKTILIELLGLGNFRNAPEAGCKFALHFHQQRISLLPEIPTDFDVLIKGTPLSLCAITLSKKNRNQFFAEDVIIEGNIEAGQEMIDLFDQLEIDWEEYLSKVMGDIPAHQLGKMARSIKSFMANAHETMLQNINEYLHEEKNYFPSEEMLQDFFQDIDQIRMDVDRLEARIKQLKI